MVWLDQRDGGEGTGEGRPMLAMVAFSSGFNSKQQGKVCFIISDQLFQSSLGLLCGEVPGGSKVKSLGTS